MVKNILCKDVQRNIDNDDCLLKTHKRNGGSRRGVFNKATLFLPTSTRSSQVTKTTGDFFQMKKELSDSGICFLTMDLFVLLQSGTKE